MNLETISLDQLRVFTKAAELGSFSAVGRELGRAQSAISYAITTLETQLGLSLFDRSGHTPRLTEQGTAILADAKSILARTEGLHARAAGLRDGLEPELAIVIDVMYPVPRLARVLGDFRERFPTVTMRVGVEVLGAVAEHVMNGRAKFGVIGSMPFQPAGLVGDALPPIRLIPVAAPTHALATMPRENRMMALTDEVQLVLTDRSRLTEGKDYAVYSAKTWRLSDLGTKLEFLRAGLSWGNMPEHLVQEDILSGRLVHLCGITRSVTEWLPMHLVRHPTTALGPAGRWLWDAMLAPSNN
jgi:DNA-binding transcriptional LysR family regulator